MVPNQLHVWVDIIAEMPRIVKYFSHVTRIAIIRSSRATESTVRAALAFIRQIKGIDCYARVIHVGGR